MLVIADEALGSYGFPDGHPFGTDRHAAFVREFRARGLPARCLSGSSRLASDADLLRFHTARHVEFVRAQSVTGQGSLDGSDTPAYRGCFEAASRVVGATLSAAEALLDGGADRAFVPIAGLHHAARDAAAGFCIFNDIGVLIEMLRARGVGPIAYVDIDVHHGDGVFYAFESDADVIFADLHEDGTYLYPGTGKAEECGRAAGQGLKLNIPLPPGADDDAFAARWPEVISLLERHRPQFIILQCGADGLAGDPLAHLRLSAASHALAARTLAGLADRLGHGRLLALGGGGYDRGNLAAAWNAVVEALLQS
ncbi:MAG: acetoin utilization protein AcuC [Proteobacteria bacterium]|nr:acetoin utilization protein AcuC [Pseudomonadota bacterium]